MRSLTSIIIAIAMGASAPGVAQTTLELSDELEAEFERAAPTEDDGSTATADTTKRKGNKTETRTERVTETTTEFETDAMQLPSAAELLSGDVDVDESEDTPRAPRAVQRRTGVVERTYEIVEARPDDAEAVAGDEEFRSRGWLPMPQSEAPGEARAGAARVVPPTVYVEGDRDRGSRAISEPIMASRNLAADPDIGQPIDPSALEEMVDTELRNIAGRRMENIGTLRASLDAQLQDLSLSASPVGAVGAPRAELASLQQQLAEMNTEIHNVEATLEQVGPDAVPPEVADLRERIIRAQDRLMTMRDASSADVYRTAMSDFRRAIGDIERARVALERARR